MVRLPLVENALRRRHIALIAACFVASFASSAVARDNFLILVLGDAGVARHGDSPEADVGDD